MRRALKVLRNVVLTLIGLQLVGYVINYIVVELVL